MTSYKVSGRRAPMVIVGLLILLFSYAGVITLALMSDIESETVLTVVLAATGGVVLGMILLLLFALRVFKWTVHARELEMEERGRVFRRLPFRQARIPFASIVALRQIEMGREVMAEAETERGVRYHLPCKLTPTAGSLIPAPDLAGHEAFIAGLLEAITKAGLRPPVLQQGLGFWQRPFGLGVLTVCLVLATSFAAVAIWALADGARMSTGAAKGLPLVILLPAGAGWLLWRALKRRGAVLKAMAGGKG